MREGYRAVARWPPRRFRLASPATALVLGVLTLALIAAEWPFAGLAHLGVNANTGGPQWWVYAPFAVVGFVVARRKPGNPLGWCLLGMGVTGALSGAGSLYAIAAYRVRPGTGLLIGVYAGLVLLAQQVFRFSSPVAVAASTLAAAALFNPVRRRVQHAVDRRFNRARYDADQTVTHFAARLQDAVDLDAVRDDLAGVVQAALEPAHLALWTAPHE